jgi:hypothetical protein
LYLSNGSNKQKKRISSIRRLDNFHTGWCKVPYELVAAEGAWVGEAVATGASVGTTGGAVGAGAVGAGATVGDGTVVGTGARVGIGDAGEAVVGESPLLLLPPAAEGALVDLMDCNVGAFVLLELGATVVEFEALSSSDLLLLILRPLFRSVDDRYQRPLLSLFVNM